MRRLPRPVLALLAALALLAIAEGALSSRVAPADDVPMPYREGASGFGPQGVPLEDDVVRAHPDGGWETRMHGQRISASKGRRRIVVLGESAVAGGGLPFADTFPARLEALLPSWEVLNLGAPARDSAQIRGLLDWALEHAQPDVVILYCGNNEFHRLRAYRHFHPRWSAGSERVRLVLQRLALYRWLAAARPEPATEPSRPLEIPLEDLEVSVGPDDVALVSEHYRGNLVAMARACRARGVPLILCTVAVNEVFPPGWGHDASSAAEPYARGMAALRAGDARSARTELSRAVERNPRPDRALPSFSRVVAEVAAAEGVPLADVEAGLRQTAPDGILGASLFGDACHFTAEGNRRVAEILAARVAALRE